MEAFQVLSHFNVGPLFKLPKYHMRFLVPKSYVAKMQALKRA